MVLHSNNHETHKKEDFCWMREIANTSQTRRIQDVLSMTWASVKSCRRLKRYSYMPTTITTPAWDILRANLTNRLQLMQFNRQSATPHYSRQVCNKWYNMSYVDDIGIRIYNINSYLSIGLRPIHIQIFVPLRLLLSLLLTLLLLGPITTSCICSRIACIMWVFCCYVQEHWFESISALVYNWLSCNNVPKKYLGPRLGTK